MKGFIEKWNTDSRFKAKIKLGISTLFVLFVTIFVISNRQYIPENIIDNNDKEMDNVSIKIPDEYNYTINISINEKTYKYTGTKTIAMETISKTIDETTENYIYKDNTYYKETIGINNITNKDEIYDIVSYNYINTETINKYLSISTKENDRYIVYLKDIILGNDSEEYITITVDVNKTNIDYTSLMKNFDKTIESYKIEVIIEEKE